MNLAPECRVNQFGIPIEVIRIMDPAPLPEKLTISLGQPDIRLLPDKVADRIEDMWRVGAMLSGFHKLSHAAKERKELLTRR